VKLPSGDKPAYVEWDRTGDAGAYGAIIYLAAAPMVLVHEIPLRYRSDREVQEAVEAWVAAESDRYRLNEDFERFKTVAREFEDDGDESRGYFV
jgi:hypothetical protein